MDVTSHNSVRYEVYHAVTAILTQFMQGAFSSGIEGELKADLFNKCSEIFKNVLNCKFIESRIMHKCGENTMATLVTTFITIIDTITVENVYMCAETLYPFLGSLFSHAFRYTLKSSQESLHHLLVVSLLYLSILIFKLILRGYICTFMYCKPLFISVFKILCLASWTRNPFFIQ